MAKLIKIKGDASFRSFFRKTNVKKNSIIVTSKKGMNWTSNLTSKLSFKLNNFLKKEIKESKGKISNILSKEECINLAKKNQMKLIYPKQTNIVIFKKT